MWIPHGHSGLFLKDPYSHSGLPLIHPRDFFLSFPWLWISWISLQCSSLSFRYVACCFQWCMWKSALSVPILLSGKLGNLWLQDNILCTHVRRQPTKASEQYWTSCHEKSKASKMSTWNQSVANVKQIHIRNTTKKHYKNSDKLSTNYTKSHICANEKSDFWERKIHLACGCWQVALREETEDDRC